MKLRVGTAAFQIKVGRWREVKREERDSIYAKNVGAKILKMYVTG